MTNSRLLTLFLTILFLVTSAQAQQPPENAELREKAYDLLESVAGQIGTLQSAENRARLGANVADSLWPHDEKRARLLFLEVEADIRSALQKWQPQTGDDLTLYVFLKLRADTVERIAKHDGVAALAFLKGTELKSDQLPKQAYRNTDDIEMRLAQKVAADNPEAAVTLGRASLERGFSYDQIALLRRLNRKHRDAAQTLYKEIVSKLQSTNLLTDWTARYFASNLAKSFRPPSANEASYRELIATFVTTALKNGCGNKIDDDNINRNYCQWLVYEVPELEKFDARAARLRHWGTNPEDSTPPAVYELTEILEVGSQEEILTAAAKHPEFAEQVYLEVIYRARKAGNFDEARRLINTYITDPQRQREALTKLENTLRKEKIDEATLAQIEETFNALPVLSQRVAYLLSLAQRYGPSDQKLTFKLLDRASDLIDTMKPDKIQTSSQIALAEFYCYEKSDRGLVIMESLVPKLNELVEFAAKLDGYDTNYLRDGEWNMSANGSVGELLTRLSQNANLFAWCDFDRAVNIASRFERNEIRMMAQIRLAQGILAGPVKRNVGLMDGY